MLLVMSTISLPPADDMHHHLRDGLSLSLTVDHASSQFQRCIVMPNLKPPVVSTEMALAYRERIMNNVPKGRNFEPLMTLYMTDKTSPEEIKRAKDSGKVFAVKYYPAGATTNSDSGVTDIENVYPALEAMSELCMPLLIHGEVTHDEVDIFDRENEFIQQVLKPLINKFPNLKIVMEHITTKDAVDFILSTSSNVAATITCHHLLYNRNAIFHKGLQPHKYCLPVLKREIHRQALLKAIQSGNSKFFLGTDSAPHAVENKLSECGCAGIYTAHAALELYAEAFESVNALHLLKKFACENGAKFYNLPFNEGQIHLKKESWKIPSSFAFDKSIVIPLKANEIITWKKEN